MASRKHEKEGCTSMSSDSILSWGLKQYCFTPSFSTVLHPYSVLDQTFIQYWVGPYDSTEWECISAGGEFPTFFDILHQAGYISSQECTRTSAMAVGCTNPLLQKAFRQKERGGRTDETCRDWISTEHIPYAVKNTILRSWGMLHYPSGLRSTYPSE